jgi:hypothetical protein
VSIWSDDTTPGDGVETSGDLAYQDDVGTLYAWDSDDDAGPGLHFGLSVHGDWLTDGTMPNQASTPVLWLLVRNQVGGDFTLHVQTQDAADVNPWPIGTAPIFLKGGEGRQFLAHTYSVGSLRVNAGEAIKTVSQFWDLSHRDSFQFIPDPDPANPDDPGEVPSLMFDAGVIKNRVKAVLPDADFTGSVLSDDPAAQIDIFNETPLDFGLGGDLLTAVPQAEDAQFGTLTFCAYPYSLSTSNTVTGGYMAVGF